MSQYGVFADMVLKEQRKLGLVEPMPSFDKHWLGRFKQDKGIVFRRPNQRFKCSKPVLLRRLRAMWLNIIRVRRLAEVTLGTDLSGAFYGIDEKPIHFNEAGSKQARTLELEGAPAVPLFPGRGALLRGPPPSRGRWTRGPLKGAPAVA